MTTSPATDDSQRLNKYLAFHLGVSRREADSLIEHNHVTVNNVPAVLGGRIAPNDTVLVKGKPVTVKNAYSYLALHKPTGYVCSRKQQGETPTIYSLLAKEYYHLKPVGRLDANSSGLLLLSDDGDFTFQMTHPKFYKTKTYLVQLNKPLAPLHQQMISDFGVTLEDGPSKFTVMSLDNPINYPGFSHQEPVYEIVMHEGRNRQIRRTFAALGYTVTSLHRTIFGNYQLGDLRPGESAKFTPSL